MSGERQFTFAILGAGDRGGVFARWLREHPDAGRVVAVAEPIAERRSRIAQMHDIPVENQFQRWEQLLDRPRLADVVINTLMDRLHVDSSVKALDLGYHMLLEKPMATSLQDCIAIDQARQRNRRIVSVCHSLRYHGFYTEIKRLLDQGAIGELVSFDQLEAVEHVHQSHSFVRGNWGNEDRSTFMLLAKSCHDMDVLAWLVGRDCKRVSSFGSLHHFHQGNKPVGAPEYCVQGCPAESECPYSAIKVYLQEEMWVKHTTMAGKPADEILQTLKTSPYGRCVYQCDNDVVDHQVVALEFGGGITGTFTMTAFTLEGGRSIRLHGTKGFLRGNMESNAIEVHRFADRTFTHIEVGRQRGSHGGGDANIMGNLVTALRKEDPDAVLTTTAASLETHKIAFAAERARREGRVVELAELRAGIPVPEVVS